MNRNDSILWRCFNITCILRKNLLLALICSLKKKRNRWPVAFFPLHLQPLILNIMDAVLMLTLSVGLIAKPCPWFCWCWRLLAAEKVCDDVQQRVVSHWENVFCTDSSAGETQRTQSAWFRPKKLIVSINNTGKTQNVGFRAVGNKGAYDAAALPDGYTRTRMAKTLVKSLALIKWMRYACRFSCHSFITRSFYDEKQQTCSYFGHLKYEDDSQLFTLNLAPYLWNWRSYSLSHVTN